MGAAIVRGSQRDVLRRYVQTAREFSLTEIIRATADNPAVNMDAPRRTLELLHQTGADHVVEFGLPNGAAVEAVTVEALRRPQRPPPIPRTGSTSPPSFAAIDGFSLIPAISVQASLPAQLRLRHTPR